MKTPELKILEALAELEQDARKDEDDYLAGIFKDASSRIVNHAHLKVAYKSLTNLYAQKNS